MAATAQLTLSSATAAKSEEPPHPLDVARGGFSGWDDDTDDTKPKMRNPLHAPMPSMAQLAAQRAGAPAGAPAPATASSFREEELTVPIGAIGVPRVPSKARTMAKQPTG